MIITEKKKREEILNKIEAISENLGLGDRWGFDGRNPVNYSGNDYGLCNTCKNKIVIKTRYTIKTFKCDENDSIKLSTDDPVIDCSKYEKLGALTLNQMVEIAHLIDLKKETKVGF